ncbi:hypothetical protein AAC387_Pa10g2088 [Persea americana]
MNQKLDSLVLWLYLRQEDSLSTRLKTEMLPNCCLSASFCYLAESQETRREFSPSTGTYFSGLAFFSLGTQGARRQPSRESLFKRFNTYKRNC